MIKYSLMLLAALGFSVAQANVELVQVGSYIFTGKIKKVGADVVFELNPGTYSSFYLILKDKTGRRPASVNFKSPSLVKARVMVPSECGNPCVAHLQRTPSKLVSRRYLKTYSGVLKSKDAKAFPKNKKRSASGKKSKVS